MPARLHGPLLDATLFGYPDPLGTIVATTTATNNATAVGMTPFATDEAGLSGKALVLIPDAACTIRVGSESTVAAVATDYPLTAGVPFPINMPSDARFLSIRGDDGTVNVRVYELR